MKWYLHDITWNDASKLGSQKYIMACHGRRTYEFFISCISLKFFRQVISLCVILWPTIIPHVVLLSTLPTIPFLARLVWSFIELLPSPFDYISHASVNSPTSVNYEPSSIEIPWFFIFISSLRTLLTLWNFNIFLFIQDNKLLITIATPT